MKKLLKLACAGSFLLAGTNALAVDAPALDAWLKETVAKNQIVGLTAVIVEDGKTVFQKTYGYTDLEAQTPVTGQHLFHVASVSKPMVAVGIMQLYEAGRVDLDAPVATYLPYFTMDDARTDGVTVRRLLAHISGMPDVQDFGFDVAENDDGALERWVREQAGKKLLSDPGTEHSYSNIGFDMLGDVIAKVSGMSFEDYMISHVLRPLGLKYATYTYPDVPQAKRVKGYTGASKPYLIEHYPYRRRHAPSGTLQLSGDELARLLTVFSNPERVVATGLLKADTVTEMWTVLYKSSEKRQHTHGWSQHVTDTGTVIRHGGWDTGFRAEIGLYRDRDVGYGLMTNRELAPINTITDAIRRASVDAELPPVPENAGIKARAAYESGGLPAMLAFLQERMAAGDGGAGYAVYGFGEDLTREGRHDEALALARAMLGAVPNHPLLTYRVAQTLYNTGDKAAALAMAQEALKLNPGQSEASDLLAKIEAGE